MTRLSTLMMSSMLAIGTGALAQTGPASVPGTNESGSSISNPAGVARTYEPDADAATPPIPAHPVPYVPVNPDSGAPNELYSGA